MKFAAVRKMPTLPAPNATINVAFSTQAIFWEKMDKIKHAILRNEANLCKMEFFATVCDSNSCKIYCRNTLHCVKKTKPNYACSGFRGKRAFNPTKFD